VRERWTWLRVVLNRHAPRRTAASSGRARSRGRRRGCSRSSVAPSPESCAAAGGCRGGATATAPAMPERVQRLRHTDAESLEAARQLPPIPSPRPSGAGGRAGSSSGSARSRCAPCRDGRRVRGDAVRAEFVSLVDLDESARRCAEAREPRAASRAARVSFVESAAAPDVPPADVPSSGVGSRTIRAEMIASS